MSRTSASETSLMTRRERALLWRNPVPERLLLSLSVVLRSGREAPMAGKSPKRMPVRRETPRVKRRTRQSRPTAAPFSPMRGRSAGRDGEQRAHAGVAEDEAEDAAGEREDDAFGEQLADDAGAAGAHGGADGEFTLAAGGADEEEIGDVGAGDEQDEADGSEEDEERGARVADDGVAERLDAEAVFGSHAVRVVAAELVGGEFELGVGLGEGNAGLEAAGGEKVVALVGAVGVDLEGEPDVGFGIGDEGFSEDADDGVGLVAEREGGADDVGVAAEFALPEAVADDDDFAAVRGVFLRREGAAEHDGRAEEAEIGFGDVDAVNLFGTSPVRLKPGPPKS